MKTSKPRTIGELRASGYRVLTVREEMRKNLIGKIRRGEELFPGLVGFDDTVIPQVENAIMAGQDVIFLGERGQAKTRLIRNLVNFLDQEIPVIAGCEINDNPYHPICRACHDKVEEWGDATEIAWLPRDQRYGEKLATPDITIADILGEVDPIRVAEGRYLSDELTIHYGLVPRTNRGIFAINELPDLAERIQVGLLNIMEERDIQIKGHRVRLPLDVYIVATANPEDYTNRGRIITPLKDRYGAQIRTHYPRTGEQEIQIAEQEQAHFVDDGAPPVLVPRYMTEVVAEITHLARRSSEINQRSGVSVRVTIANQAGLVSSALRRAIRLEEPQAVPRVSDLPFLLASTVGKIEMETVEDGKEEQLVDKLIRGAILNVFNRYFSPQDFPEVLARFDAGLSVEVSHTMPSLAYMEWWRQLAMVGEAQKLGVQPDDPAQVASAMEFMLEGLHLNRRLNKDRFPGKSYYRGR